MNKDNFSSCLSDSNDLIYVWNLFQSIKIQFCKIKKIFTSKNVWSYWTYSRIYSHHHFTKLMNLIPKGHGNTHRGVIGIESAIVLIAFVIVAAALAFVVLNMGFATSQKAKTSITSALSEAGSSLLVSGKVIGDSINSADNMTAIMIPIKLTSGGDTIDLNTTRAKISYLANDVEFDNVYTNACTLNGVTYATPILAWFDANAGACAAGDPMVLAGGGPPVTTAIIYWAVDEGSFNTILEQGEHAVLSLGFNRTNDAPTSLDKVKIELTVTGGATLTIERDVPNISSRVIDLG